MAALYLTPRPRRLLCARRVLLRVPIRCARILQTSCFVIGRTGYSAAIRVFRAAAGVYPTLRGYSPERGFLHCACSSGVCRRSFRAPSDDIGIPSAPEADGMASAGGEHGHVRGVRVCDGGSEECDAEAFEHLPFEIGAGFRGTVRCGANRVPGRRRPAGESSAEPQAGNRWGRRQATGAIPDRASTDPWELGTEHGFNKTRPTVPGLAKRAGPMAVSSSIPPGLKCLTISSAPTFPIENLPRGRQRRKLMLVSGCGTEDAGPRGSEQGPGHRAYAVAGDRLPPSAGFPAGRGLSVWSRFGQSRTAEGYRHYSCCERHHGSRRGALSGPQSSPRPL